MILPYVDWQPFLYLFAAFTVACALITAFIYPDEALTTYDNQLEASEIAVLSMAFTNIHSQRFHPRAFQQ